MTKPHDSVGTMRKPLTLDASPGEVFGHFSPGTMEPSLDRSDRAVHDDADLFVRKRLLVEEAEDGPIFRAKLGKGSGQLARKVIRIVQTGPRVDDRLAGVLHEGPARLLPQRSSAAVCGDAEQPGAQGTICVESPRSSKCPDKCLLHHVLRVMPMPHHAQAEAEYDSLILRDERSRRIFVSSTECVDQRTVILRLTFRHARIDPPQSILW